MFRNGLAAVTSRSFIPWWVGNGRDLVQQVLVGFRDRGPGLLPAAEELHHHGFGTADVDVLHLVVGKQAGRTGRCRTFGSRTASMTAISSEADITPRPASAEVKVCSSSCRMIRFLAISWVASFVNDPFAAAYSSSCALTAVDDLPDQRGIDRLCGRRCR